MIEMIQSATFPQTLDDLIVKIGYKKGWAFWLENKDRGQGSYGLTFVIRITTPNSYDPEQIRNVLHYFPVPPAAYNDGSWRRWIFQQILLVEQHEAAEFFKIGDDRPYAPNHGPGEDPYILRELATDEQRRTQFTGKVKE